MQRWISISAQEDYAVPANSTLGIFLISVLGLFVEMLLIRWIGTEVRIFAYLQNTILVVCFLGLGLGLFTSRQPIVFRQSLVPLAVLVLLMAVPVTRAFGTNISQMLSLLGDFTIWEVGVAHSFWSTAVSVALGLAGIGLLMLLVLDIFVPIGRILGRLMDEHPHTILAYSVNIGGSLVGTWLFVLLSLFYQGPVTWFILVALLMLFFLRRTGSRWLLNLGLLAVIVAGSWVAGLVPGAVSVIWSPYQKLVTLPTNGTPDAPGKYLVGVNNTGYQMMVDLSDANLAAHPDQYPAELRGLSQYDIPLLLHPDPKTFLVVGAGTGNDAAGGLRHGVREITAVEIDPAIIDLGRRFHPENPYGSPAVRVVNDDARSFFATTSGKYDVISFGLLDSHTTTAMTNARLDHYVYTRESISKAKSLLAPGGVMVLSFEAQKPFIADRMASVLAEVFGQDPLVFRIPGSTYGWGGVLFVTGDLSVVHQQLARNPRLAGFIEQMQQQYPVPLSHTTRIATDDWPYIYLVAPAIPSLYYLLGGLLALILWRSYKRWGASGLVARWQRPHWHFFFLGAAFLLLEVQNVSKASVVLGNTWQVNAVIVSAVLAMALVANLLAYKFPTLPVGIVYAGLIATSLGLYFVDLAQFAFLPYTAKALVVGGLTALPMLFSGIIFVRSFAAVTGKDETLGANMIGSLAGALLQSITFVVGIKALLLLVALLYLASWLTRPRPARQEEPALAPVLLP